MALYKNVTKMELNIRTPKAKSFLPGEVFDLDVVFAGSELAGTDLERYMNKGFIISVSPAAQAIKTPNGAIVVTPTKPEEGSYIPKSVMGNVERKGNNMAAVVTAPPDEVSEEEKGIVDPFTPASNLNLPDEILGKIEQVKKIISGAAHAPEEQVLAPQKSTSDKKVSVPNKKGESAKKANKKAKK